MKSTAALPTEEDGELDDLEINVDNSGGTGTGAGAGAGGGVSGSRSARSSS